MPEPPVPHRGLLIPQFPPQSLDLPSITISRNMMDQDGVSVNNGQAVVSTAFHTRHEQIEKYFDVIIRQHPEKPALVQLRYL